MKPPLISLLLLPALHCLAQTSPEAPATAPEKKPPVIRTVKTLAECPEAVQAGLKRDGHTEKVTEIRTIETAGQKLWAFETGSEEDGRDAEVNYFYSADGVLVRTESDLPLKDAPAPVQQKLKELAGTTAVVDDVEKVDAQGKISYKAELESNGGMDRKVILAPDGAVLSLAEESDD